MLHCTKYIDDKASQNQLGIIHRVSEGELLAQKVMHALCIAEMRTCSFPLSPLVTSDRYGTQQVCDIEVAQAQFWTLVTLLCVQYL
jgi:hypothetical protein